MIWSFLTQRETWFAIPLTVPQMNRKFARVRFDAIYVNPMARDFEERHNVNKMDYVTLHSVMDSVLIR